jgi:hypothetical protein
MIYNRLAFIFIAVPISFLIAGCSTPGDLRKKSPALDMNSAKNSRDVIGCVAVKLQDALGSRARLNSRPISDGYTVWVDADVTPFGKDTSIVVDVTDTKNGSNTRFYSNMGWNEEKVTKVLRDCQGNSPVNGSNFTNLPK